MNQSLIATFDALGIQDPAQRQWVTGLLRRVGAFRGAPQPALVMVDPAVIRTDPETYQFRAGADRTNGVTQRGRFQAGRWDPILHGEPLLLHERADGTLYVADGHHRLELAQRTNALGAGPGQVAAQVLREADGYTARDAKIVAAYKNIQHGQTDLIDTARVFREAESGLVNTALLPQLDMDKGNLRLSYRLSKLGDGGLGMVARGEVPAHMAADVAGRTQDPGLQESALRIIGARLQQDYDLRRPGYDVHMRLDDPARQEIAPPPGFLARLQQERGRPAPVMTR